ncbi:hypothetical protein [Ancylobacter sp.]|uniref:hypothetical protein n=1 Tax=Ancylobacter sp. TaxID=1872567 RepID=UPI003D123A28
MIAEIRRGCGGDKVADLLSKIVEVIVSGRMYYSAILAVVSGLILIASNYGIKVPAEIEKWTGVILILSSVIFVFDLFIKIVNWSKMAIAERNYNRRQDEECIRNIQSLNYDELRLLSALLLDIAPKRFEVGMYSPLSNLLDKGMLRVVRHVDNSTTICELHPAISARAEVVKKSLPPPNEDIFTRWPRH